MARNERKENKAMGSKEGKGQYREGVKTVNRGENSKGGLVEQGRGNQKG